jgi:ankyrin repeat protein
LDVVALLVDAGSDVVGEGDDHQVGVLGWATCFTRVREDVAAYLLAHGAKLIVTLLLAAGAKLDFLSALYLERYDEADAMLRHNPSRIGPDGRDTIALHLSVSRKNTAAVRWLIAHGVDLNAKGNLWDCSHTALHMTAESGAVEMARLLLDAGADPNIRDDKYDATVLGWAEYCEQPQIAELVRGRGGTA